jgi:hypothetical protein
MHLCRTTCADTQGLSYLLFPGTQLCFEAAIAKQIITKKGATSAVEKERTKMIKQKQNHSNINNPSILKTCHRKGTRKTKLIQ